MRWLIRLEPVRTPKFGETRRDVSEWVVRSYLGTRATRPEERKLSRPLVSYPGLTTAINWARAASIIHNQTVANARRPIPVRSALPPHR